MWELVFFIVLVVVCLSAYPMWNNYKSMKAVKAEIKEAERQGYTHDQWKLKTLIELSEKLGRDADKIPEWRKKLADSMAAK